MRSFKKPLKAEEERKYLKMYRDGDETAKEKLIEHNLRLVAHIVKKYNSWGAVPMPEDMLPADHMTFRVAFRGIGGGGR